MTAPRLVLDEMFAPRLAVMLREGGHDVIAVADRDDLRAMTDDDLFAWAGAQDRWLVTENVKEFRPIMFRASRPAAPPHASCSPAAVHFPGPDSTSVRSSKRYTLGSPTARPPSP